MVDRGLEFIKRKTEDGCFYFIVNRSDSAFDGWIPIQTRAGSVGLFDPMSGNLGLAAWRTPDNESTEVYLQLEKGESCILKMIDGIIKALDYPYHAIKGSSTELTGEWNIQFITGGPVLPDDIKTRTLTSWTELNEEGVKSFSGTAQYTIQFKKPKTKADFWMLDLGSVYKSARVTLNGFILDTLIIEPYQVQFSDVLLRDQNELIIRVSNLMANRIAYMDRNRA